MVPDTRWEIGSACGLGGIESSETDLACLFSASLFAVVRFSLTRTSRVPPPPLFFYFFTFSVLPRYVFYIPLATPGDWRACMLGWYTGSAAVLHPGLWTSLSALSLLYVFVIWLHPSEERVFFCWVTENARLVRFGLKEFWNRIRMHRTEEEELAC